MLKPSSTANTYHICGSQATNIEGNKRADMAAKLAHLSINLLTTTDFSYQDVKELQRHTWPMGKQMGKIDNQITQDQKNHQPLDFSRKHYQKTSKFHHTPQNRTYPHYTLTPHEERRLSSLFQLWYPSNRQTRYIHRISELYKGKEGIKPTSQL